LWPQLLEGYTVSSVAILLMIWYMPPLFLSLFLTYIF
jgi:hypothetical protein